MKPVVVRNVAIGEAIPKICVPIVGKTIDEILNQAKHICEIGADVVEWRVDWFEEVNNYESVENAAKQLRDILGETPILFTFRTAKEGGERAIEPDEYVELNEKIAKSGYVDLVDVEAFIGDTYVEKVVKTSHECGVKVIASNHDFRKTPPKAELISRMRKMQELGADIPKIAVMPQSTICSTRNASEVRNTDPMLLRLRMLSSTTTRGIFLRRRYSSRVSRPMSRMVFFSMREWVGSHKVTKTAGRLLSFV